jgi:uncharacterized protein
MNTEAINAKVLWRAGLVLGLLVQATAPVAAQSPAPASKAAPAGGLSSPVGTPPPGVGGGPGFHDPRSAVKPLEERDDVVSWKLLTAVKAKVEKTKVLPIFPDGVRALDTKSVKVQGFMLPLDPGEKQRHFLLSAVPTSCNFCVPAGPEGLIEVRSKEPVRYTVEAITLQGRFSVLSDDKFGLFYRVADAVVAP